ncbi:MAG: polysaccharide biosynthesis/export family protein [Candidatus Hydrogenedentes bacterium]|nr:polysaccharide biosynthesis/export family protein [Candidatus Hydrogenedentota bacterium]
MKATRMTTRSGMIALLAILVAIGLALPATAQAPGELPLNAGDLVFVNVHREPEFSTTTQVDENGNVSIPYIGNVSIKGLSAADASARISSALTVMLKNPRVTVSRSTGGAPMVGTGERTEEMVAKVVHLENSNAEVMANSLTGMSSPGGAISFDPDTNTLLVTDTPSALQNIMGVAMELDQMSNKTTQIHIESRIAEVEKDALKEVGIRWFAQGDRAAGGYIPGSRQTSEATSIRGVDSFFNEQLGSSGNNGNNTSSGRRFLGDGNFDRRLQVPAQLAAPGQMFFGFLNSGIDLGVFLDALVADDKAETLATPYISTVNHKPAHIEMIEKFPYTELGTAGLSTVANVQFLDVGIKLDVTPHVHTDTSGERYVRLELKPEVSTATGVANGVPVRAIRSSESVADARDGQTIVIGGIVMADSRDVVQKIPGLGSLPLFGHLFKHTEKAKGSRELMIFVTPRIFDRPDDLKWDRSINLSEAVGGADLMQSLERRAELGQE